MRHVLIPVGTGLALRNVLRTDLPSELLDRGLRPVFCVPAPLHAQLAAEPDRIPGELTPMPAFAPPRSEVVLRDLELGIVHRRARIATMEILLRDRARRRERRPWKERVAPLLGTSRLVYRMLRSARLRLYRGDECAGLFERWTPVAVFANNVFHAEESAVLRQAQHRGVPAIAMVHSWDNPSTKGGLPVTPDLLLVWSDAMAEEMTSYFGVPDAAMPRVGSPQFDIYSRDLEITRERLLSDYGFANETRIVVYATAAPGHCPQEPVYPTILAGLLERTQDRGPLGLVIRLHPRDREERYRQLLSHPLVRLETAGRRGEGVDDRFNPTDEDHVHLAALMRWSAVVVNVASTMALDAAANDTPVVHVGFDPEPVDEYLDSIERFFDYTHTTRLIGYGAAPVTRSPDELCTEVLRALDSPDERAPARTLLARGEGVDGRGESAARIADAIARRATR
jgi:hypothetical protein